MVNEKDFLVERATRLALLIVSATASASILVPSQNTSVIVGLLVLLSM
jgi:hypothetical protein